MKDIAVFTKFEGKFILMHIKDDRTEHIYVYDSLDSSPIGTVYNCLVEKNVDNIDASFVRYSAKETGFINKRLKCGTIIPLQYKKEAYNDKKAAFSDKISVSTEYVAVTKDTGFVKVSSKIPQPQCADIAEEIKRSCQTAELGIIVRTKAGESEDGVKKAVSDIGLAAAKLDEIYEKSSHVPQYEILYRPLPPFIEDLLYLSGIGIEEIVTDGEDIREAVESSYETLSDSVSVTDRVGLRYYDDNLVSLANLYSFRARLDEALKKTVYLKSGAYITFDTTEAMTVIDVNSSSSSQKVSREESFLNINREAAVEIARQLRLRNISGMIIVDFINMRSKDYYDELADLVRSLIVSDRAGCRFVDFTGLYLAELVRKRSGRPLYLMLRK